MSPLFRELLAAHRLARQPDLAAALDACGLRQVGAPIWGVAFVAVDRAHYAPAPGGKTAIIVPAFADGVLVDLVATGLQTRECRTRAGIATVLGAEWIDHARDSETALTLFPDPLEWLRCGRRGAVVVDWRAARFTLADLPGGIACTSESVAQRVDRAMRHPVQVPQLFIREAARAAA